MTPNKLYSIPPQEISTDITILKGSTYNHVPEIDEHTHLWGVVQELPRIRIAIIKHFDFDSRRFWRLANVWFDEAPVMIIRNAGREGEDHASRFVTDVERYKAMIVYIRSLLGVDQPTDVVKPNDDIPDLTKFYGYSLEYGPFVRS